MRRKLVLTILLSAALFIKALVPPGWMPDSHKTFAITVCTGMGMETVWLDKSGTLHKKKPAKEQSTEQKPCAFAGAAAALDIPPAITVIVPVPDRDIRGHRSVGVAHIGQGLAAPPPPSTGPPFLT